MGSFSNTLFSILLGWIQTLVSMIWSAFTAKGGESFFQFVGQNWIIIAVILCVAGLILDFVVYLFRWKPYKVWGTFLRHLKKQEPVPQEDQDCITCVGTSVPEKTFKENSNGQDDLFRWRDGDNNDADIEKDNLPEVTKAGYVVPADSPYRRPDEYQDGEQESTGRIETAPARRRRRRFTGLLGDPEDDNNFHYFAPQPVIDRKEAYHPPVYPGKWKESEEEEK